MKIFLGEYIHPDAVKTISERAEIVSNFNNIEDIDAIILRAIKVTSEMMKQAKKLKVIGKHGVGCDSIDLVTARSLGIRVIYTPGTNSQSVAELAVGSMIDISRNITLSNILCKKGEVKKIGPKELIGHELHGKTLGLIGVGNIARRIAEILQKGFAMDVIGYDLYVEKKEFNTLGIRKFESLQDMVSQADFINISVPLTEKTKYLVNEEILRHFKKDAVLVNTSRGCVVDENALYTALTEGWIKAAASDVFKEEPPTGENCLMNLPNFVGTPHIGGNTVEATRRVGLSVVEDVFRVLDGKDPLHPVV